MGHTGQSQAEGEKGTSVFPSEKWVACCLLVLGVKRNLAGPLWLMCRGPRVEVTLVPKALLSSQMLTVRHPSQLGPNYKI